MPQTTLRRLAIAALAAGSLALAACSGGSHPRGAFAGYVVGKTEAEIIDKVGQPAEVDRSNPDAPMLVYKKKTFDVDNENKTDPVTVIFLKKEADGRLISFDIGYRAG